MQILLGVMGIITLLMASISVSNVMYTAIHAATPVIGIKIAIGAQRYHIILHYLFEGLLITIAGGLLGMLMAWILTTGYNHFPFHPIRHMGALGRIHAELSPLILCIDSLILGIVGFLAALFPARKAASIDPVEALRHD